MFRRQGLLIVGICFLHKLCLAQYEFPAEFKFGVATSAYQIEGAWNVSDKAESIWDYKCHTTGIAEDGTTGDVACDSYHKYERDVEMIKDLNLDFYRFSISWPRVLPDPFSTIPSKDGSQYYSNLINELLSNDIEPMVTLYHWDIHQKLEELGGWVNPLIVDLFVDYARVIFDLYADRVKYWVTFNEAVVVCDFMQSSTPGTAHVSAFGNYWCARNLMLAHAKVWHMFNDEYRPRFGGILGMSNHVLYAYPASDSEEDVTAALLFNEQITGKYSYPLFTEEGGWPPNLQQAVAEKSAQQGFQKSRLPEFTQEEIELMKGATDFYGINHYTTVLAKYEETSDDASSITSDLNASYYYDPNGDFSELGWPIYPEGFRAALNYVKENYNNPQIIITENGFGAKADSLNDDNRVKYYRDFIQQVLFALHEDKCNITHYTAWSLMDNFEWADGLTVRFGLYHVNYEDPDLTRTPKKSALVYKEIVRSKTIDYSYEPEGFN